MVISLTRMKPISLFYLHFYIPRALWFFILGINKLDFYEELFSFSSRFYVLCLSRNISEEVSRTRLLSLGVDGVEF